MRSKSKAPADLESDEDLSLGSSVAVFFQSPHMAEKGEFSEVFFYRSTNPILESFTHDPIIPKALYLLIPSL